MTQCIVCRNPELTPILDLGETVPANNFPTAEDLKKKPETFYKLRVALCEKCSHVQLLDYVPPMEMFDHYLYMSSASSTLVGHLHGLASAIVNRLNLPSGAHVIDVGCNDGTLLQGFRNAGMTNTSGIDPAQNLIKIAGEKATRTFNDYFNIDLAQKISKDVGRAKVLTMTNTFPHIQDLHALLKAADAILDDDGMLVLEAHYLVDLLDMVAFDTVYHEHVSYWALTPMCALFDQFGFEAVDVERLPIHHGQLRAWVGRKGAHDVSPNVGDLLADEKQRRLDAPETYVKIFEKIKTIKADLYTMIEEYQAEGGHVAGYGAPAKGSTMLSYFGFSPDQIKYIADKNMLKQNRLTPGSHIPIVSPDKILEDMPAAVVIFAWNFADEIIKQLADYKAKGGTFIIPLPTVEKV